MLAGRRGLGPSLSSAAEWLDWPGFQNGQHCRGVIGPSWPFGEPCWLNVLSPSWGLFVNPQASDSPSHVGACKGLRGVASCSPISHLPPKQPCSPVGSCTPQKPRFPRGLQPAQAVLRDRPSASSSHPSSPPLGLSYMEQVGDAGEAVKDPSPPHFPFISFLLSASAEEKGASFSLPVPF